MSLSIRSFMPINTWTPVEDGQTLRVDAEERVPKYISDGRPDGQFLNLKASHLRIAAAIQFVLNPFITVGMVAGTVFQSFSCFFDRNREGDLYPFKANLLHSGKCLIRVAASPLTLLALEVTSLYGIISPNDARKVRSSLLRLGFDSTSMTEETIDEENNALFNAEDLIDSTHTSFLAGLGSVPKVSAT